jgi:hypothetical protein
MSEGYDVAQICPNGHVANSYAHSMPQFNERFCEKCGAETVTTCQECNKPIRGSYLGGGIGFSNQYTAPSFCIHCGYAFPWTKSRIEAANQLAKEMDKLNEKDREILQGSIDDMIKDTPLANVAVLRFKKIMAKIGQDAASMFRDILVDVLSETARKALWPTP